MGPRGLGGFVFVWKMHGVIFSGTGEFSERTRAHDEDDWRVDGGSTAENRRCDDHRRRWSVVGVSRALNARTLASASELGASTLIREKKTRARAFARCGFDAEQMWV